MYQSTDQFDVTNDFEVKHKKNRKSHFVRNTIIATITIILMIVIVTAVLLEMHFSKVTGNISENITTEEKVVVKDDGIRGLTLTSKYNQNDLKTTDPVEYETGGVASSASYYGGETTEEQHQKVFVSYTKIEGLKDKTVEEKINNCIIAKVESLYPQELLDDKNITRIFVSGYVMANFSDIVSISITQDISYLDSTMDTKLYGLNYDLETGNEIEFSKLFTYNTQIIPIIEQSAYEKFAWSYDSNEEDGPDNDMSTVDYSDIENKVYNTVLKYKNSDKIEYWFNEKYINLVIGDKEITIDMSKYYQNIAIYTRYLSSTDLYELDNYGVKNLFAFCSRMPQYYTDIEDKTNCYIDISIYSENNISEEILNNLKNKVKLKIAEVKQYVNENSDRAVLYAGTIYVGNYDGTVNCSFNVGRYEMSKDYYNSTFYGKIGEQARQDQVDASYYIEFDEQYVTYQEDYTEIKYNPETNEQIGTDNMDETIQNLVTPNTNTVQENTAINQSIEQEEINQIEDTTQANTTLLEDPSFTITTE